MRIIPNTIHITIEISPTQRLLSTSHPIRNGEKLVHKIITLLETTLPVQPYDTIQKLTIYITYNGKSAQRKLHADAYRLSHEIGNLTFLHNGLYGNL